MKKLGRKGMIEVGTNMLAGICDKLHVLNDEQLEASYNKINELWNLIKELMKK